MILTPIDRTELPGLLAGFAGAFDDDPLCRKVLQRITANIPDGDLLTLSTDPLHHAEAVALCRDWGFGIVDMDPHDYFTWDGSAVAVGMEPSVIVHEIGHYQCAAPSRRAVLDFGLGAGPETGRKAEANAVQTLFGADADFEEGLSSLLGILWEAELGQPAILAFLEQNWLEGGMSLHNVVHFRKVVSLLADWGLIDSDGRPTRCVRTLEDADFVALWRGL